MTNFLDIAKGPGIKGLRWETRNSTGRKYYYYLVTFTHGRDICPPIGSKHQFEAKSDEDAIKIMERDATARQMIVDLFDSTGNELVSNINGMGYFANKQGWEI